MVQKLLHVCYRVQDLEATLKFYTELFDFSISREDKFPDDKFDLVYLTVPGSDFEIELTYNYDNGPYIIGDGYSHLAIAVDDLDDMHKKCKQAGYQTSDLKGLPGTPPTYFFVSDPDGYRLEVMLEK
ncbi:lactoylglutathione lyase [Fundicoccus culcitae]|uniref:Aldoketomutase n=1 Tax=Fundicoccus culcitae TaxID=2969821 RepID=A0ABY5P554_9LACT|nr:VOC family protein [Fundicoccus culcitae]UUX33538.1 VOC family protein [Fundicoccus culcitae]